MQNENLNILFLEVAFDEAEVVFVDEADDGIQVILASMEDEEVGAAGALVVGVVWVVVAETTVSTNTRYAYRADIHGADDVVETAGEEAADVELPVPPLP